MVAVSASLKLFSLAWLGTATLLAEASSSVIVNGNPCTVESVITRDVCVIGGGSSGTYAAVRLQDLGKTVALVERQDRLGGHTNTYTDPGTGATVDYGVVLFEQLPIVNTYAALLNITFVLADLSSNGIVTEYVDLRTGEVDSTYPVIDPTAGLEGYAAQLAQYLYLESGFDLPYPVPSDLLLPFGDFVTKYALESVVPLVYSFAQGLGDFLSQATIYVLKNFDLNVLAGIEYGFLTTATNDNSLIYEHAATVLGQNVFLNSDIVAVDRSGKSGVKVLVRTPSGLTLIKSKKLVFSIPPKLDNLDGWDLSRSETNLFRQFGNSAYYTALVRDSGIPDNISVTNVGVDTLYNLPVLPGVYAFEQTGVPGLVDVKFGSAQGLPDNEVKQEIIDTIQRLQLSGKGPSNPEFAAYNSHTPFELVVPASAIAGGFYKELYSLQGQRHTYYTGAAFHTQSSPALWQFTENLMPNITAA